MESPNGSRTAVLLESLAVGNAKAFDAVFEYLYDELKGLAESKMRHDRAGQALGATGLLHEAYLRLRISPPAMPLPTRKVFFGIASLVMRRILIEYARRPRPSREPLLIDEIIDDLQSDGTNVIAVTEALDELKRLSPDQAKAVELQYYTGLTVPEIAEAMGAGQRTTENLLRFAKAWLHGKLTR